MFEAWLQIDVDLPTESLAYFSATFLHLESSRPPHHILKRIGRVNVRLRDLRNWFHRAEETTVNIVRGTEEIILQAHGTQGIAVYIYDEWRS